MKITKIMVLTLSIVASLGVTGFTNAYHVDFTSALNRMYDAGLTKYNTEVAFRGDDSITRGEASKFTSSFGSSQGLSNTYTACTFSDISGYDSTLTPHISQACKYGLLKGSNGKFMPNNNLTYAQGVTLVVRALDGFQNESGAQRRSNYYAVANTRGIELEVNQNNANNVNITRKQLGLLFYQAQLISEGNNIGTCDGTCEDPANAGSYISYFDNTSKLENDLNNGVYDGKKVIINFYADRCPTCTRVLNDIKDNLDTIPSDVVILEANYDTATDLKREYSVVRQTTFVYLDTNGNYIKTVESNRSMQDILDNL